MSRKTSKTILVCFLAFLSTMSVWLSFANPVLVNWFYGIKFGSIGDPPFVILNPLRNRSGEKEANNFIENLRSKNLEVLNIISDPERRKHFIQSEKNFDIKSFSIGDIERNENQVKFVYWIERDYGETCHSLSAYITVVKNENGWEVKDFGAVY